MRNLTTPTIVELGIVTKANGQEYHAQRLRYGTHHSVYVFRKGALQKRGMVFQTEAQFEDWKREQRGQLSLLQEN